MRKNWLWIAIGVGLAVIALAFILSRVTENDKEIPAETWADGVCTELGSWRSALAALTTADQASFSGRLDSAKDATQELVANLKALGPPQIEGGDELRTQLSTQLDTMKQDWADVQGSAQAAAEAQDATAFAVAIAALGNDLKTLGAEARSTVDALQSADASGQLQDAFAQVPSCQELRSGA